MSPYLRWLSARFAEHAAPDVRFQTASRHVIGYAAGVSAEDIGPFIRSLRTWFDDEVTLVVDPDPEVRDLLDAFDIRAFVFPRIIGWLPDLATSRLASFEHLLRQAGAGASVLLTDVRNVVFQGDPLSPIPSAIEPFAADEQSGLENMPDKAWLDAGAGRKIAELLGQTSALCAGVVAGPAASLGRLCRMMLTQSTQAPNTRGAEALLQLNLTDADIQPTPYRVAVVAPAAEARVRVIDGIVVNADGTVSPVLRGYDRHPRLLEAVSRRWNGQNPRRTRRHGRRVLLPLESSPEPTDPCVCQ